MKISLGPEPMALPSPVWVVGSYGTNEQPNIMVAAWGGICSSAPPCLAISIKKTRATHANIVQHRAFTINVPSRNFLAETDYAGSISGISVDKFSAAGLTAVKSRVVNAPYIYEFPLVLECKVLHALDIGAHTQFIAQIIDVKAEENVLGKNGFPLAEKIDPLIGSACERAYYALGEYLDQAGSPGATLLEKEPDENIG